MPTLTDPDAIAAQRVILDLRGEDPEAPIFTLSVAIRLGWTRERAAAALLELSHAGFIVFST